MLESCWTPENHLQPLYLHCVRPLPWPSDFLEPSDNDNSHNGNHYRSCYHWCFKLRKSRKFKMVFLKAIQSGLSDKAEPSPLWSLFPLWWCHSMAFVGYYVPALQLFLGSILPKLKCGQGQCPITENTYLGSYLVEAKNSLLSCPETRSKWD
jgi:hypothetical protein